MFWEFLRNAYQQTYYIFSVKPVDIFLLLHLSLKSVKTGEREATENLVLLHYIFKNTPKLLLTCIIGFTPVLFIIFAIENFSSFV